MKLNKLREEMAQSFIEALKEDRIPWEQGWHSQDRPRNAVSDYSYKGINNLWLSYIAGEKGYQDPRWCTFKQAQSQGWNVRKGEKGSRVEFWSLYDTENKCKVPQEEVRKIREQLTDAEFQKRIKPVSSVYTVFNAEQIDGVPEMDQIKIPFSAEELISQRDVLLKNMDVDFHEGGDRAFYRPSDDSITLPLAESFQDAYAYMSTLLHEAGHATGHESRLDRPVRNTFGSPAYAKEELRAEIASAFTGQALGIDGMNKEHLDNHKAYIQSWIETLENNPGELYAAIRDAEKISDYLIDKGEFDLEAKMRDLEVGKASLIDGGTIEVSEQLAGRLIEDGIGIHITKHERHYRDDTVYAGSLETFFFHTNLKFFEKSFLRLKEGKDYPESGWQSYEVSRLSFEEGRKSVFPTIECTLLEHSAWAAVLPDEVTRTYTISEFDAMMKQGLNQDVEFTIQTENLKIKESLERGDGSGGLLEYLEKNGYRKEFLESLHKEMDTHVRVVDQMKYEASSHSIRGIEDGMFQISGQLAERLAEDGIYVYVKPEDLPGQENGKRAASMQELQELSDQASGQTSLYISQETLNFLKKYGDGKEFMEDLLKAIDNPSDNSLDAAKFVSEHQEKLNALDGSQSTCIINLFGGPGSGKTTCAMSICSELKKLGYSAEYVQEFAKELVYEKNFDLLDGSEKHQFEILQEQMHRVDRLLGGDVDFIVCDAPIVLNGVYNEELTTEYSGMLQDLFHQYQNVSYFIERDEASYQQEGRLQNFQESVEKDAEIREMLDSYKISWDSCTHDMLGQIVREAVERQKPPEKLYNISLYSDQEAASIRLAVKGREPDVEEWKNDIGYKVGLAASEYLDQGMDIREVIVNHLNDIDAQCLVGDPAYTKNILSSVYSHNLEDYNNLNAILTASETEDLIKVSDQLAGRLIEDGKIDVYAKIKDPAGREDISRVADLKELSVMGQGSASLHVLKTALEKSESLFPAVECTFSESPAFEEGKMYTVSEFDSKMELEDRLYLEKKFGLLKKYKDHDGVARAIVEDGLPANSLAYMGYHKVDFTIQHGDRIIQDRQDIGDGDGSLMEFLEKSGYSKDTIKNLQEEMDTHTEFLSYQEKLQDVWNNLEQPSSIEEQPVHLQGQDNTFRMQRNQGIQSRGSVSRIKGVMPGGR